MKSKRLRVLFTALFSVFLLLFSVFVLLDTFVIARAESPEGILISDPSETISAPESVSTPEPSDSPAAEALPAGTEEASVPEPSASADADTLSYRDENIAVTVTEYRQYDTSVYVADIRVASSEYLKTALAGDTYGRNIKDSTSSIAQDNQAILAVNGDFYGARNKGYVIRNGILYRSTGSGSEDLVIYRDGSFSVIREDEVSAEELLAEGAEQVFSFGPALVENGEIAVSRNEEVGQAMASNPRTAIGILDENHYVMVVSDGRTQESQGLTLYELAEFMKSLGVRTAYNLDGGGSSTLVFQGNVINHPTTGGRKIGERSVSDIVYIGY